MRDRNSYAWFGRNGADAPRQAVAGIDVPKFGEALVRPLPAANANGSRVSIVLKPTTRRQAIAFALRILGLACRLFLAALRPRVDDGH